MLHADAVLLRRAIDNLPRQRTEVLARTRAGRSSGRRAVRGNPITGRRSRRRDRPHTPRSAVQALFRADPSRARHTGGVGLGHALSCRIAEARGGTLTAQSEVGIGTMMTLSLPFRMVDVVVDPPKHLPVAPQGWPAVGLPGGPGAATKAGGPGRLIPFRDGASGNHRLVPSRFGGRGDFLGGAVLPARTRRTRSPPGVFAAPPWESDHRAMNLCSSSPANPLAPPR